MSSEKTKSKHGENCGCCGRACSGEWCKRCAKHINPRKTFWDATYLAQHGVDCPYQNPASRLGGKSKCPPTQQTSRSRK